MRKRMPMTIAYDDFAKVDVRVGRVLRAEVNQGARKPALKLWIDFGPEVGEKAEWRVVRKYGKLRPVALIVRYIYGLDPDKFSHLVVSKITNDSACETGIVKEVKDQNVRARELADSSMNKPCLEALKR